MPRLRVAAVGAGHYGQFHLAAWRRIAEVDLVAVADSDAARAAAAAARFGIARSYGDAAEMLDRERPDLLDIATPPAGHRGLIAAAAARGIDAVCQKAFCRDLTEAEAAVAEAEAAGIRLVVHENFRFQPWYRRIAAEIAAGRIGAPWQVSFRLRTGDGRGEGAYLARQPYFRTMPRFLIRETGIHFIDTFRFLFGEVAAVSASLARLNPAIAGEDAGIVLFDFADGSRGVFDGNRLGDHAAENPRLTLGEMWVEGSAGVLRLDGTPRLGFRALGSREEREIAFAWSAEEPGGGSVLALQRHLVGHLLHGAPLENAARDYLRNLRIEEAVYAAAAEGRRITLPPAAV